MNSFLQTTQYFFFVPKSVSRRSERSRSVHILETEKFRVQALTHPLFNRLSITFFQSFNLYFAENTFRSKNILMVKLFVLYIHFLFLELTEHCIWETGHPKITFLIIKDIKFGLLNILME